MPQHRFIACIFAVLLSFGVGANAQQPKSFGYTVMSSKYVEAGLESVLNFLSGQSKDPTREFLALHESPEQAKSLGAAVSTALASTTIIAKADIDYSTQYVQMLEYDLRAFEAYAAAIEEKTMIILDLANKVVRASADLVLKAKVVQDSNTDRVKVEVNTIDGAKNKVNGWYVFYSPYYQDDKDHTHRFDDVSTTTIELMSPAKWNLWLEKDGKKGEKMPFECGDDGRKYRYTEIIVPQ